MVLQNRSMFKHIVKAMEFPKIDLPVHAAFPRGDYSLYDANSKICFLISWFMTVEPPIYAVLNEAIRKSDLKKLPMVGPLATALYVMLLSAEKYRVSGLGDPPIQPGYDIAKTSTGNDLGSFCNSFLLFSGVQMKPLWIKKWASLAGKLQRPNDKTSTIPLSVQLHTNHFATYSLVQAL